VDSSHGEVKPKPTRPATLRGPALASSPIGQTPHLDPRAPPFRGPTPAVAHSRSTARGSGRGRSGGGSLLRGRPSLPRTSASGSWRPRRGQRPDPAWPGTAGGRRAHPGWRSGRRGWPHPRAARRCSRSRQERRPGHRPPWLRPISGPSPSGAPKHARGRGDRGSVAAGPLRRDGRCPRGPRTGAGGERPSFPHGGGRPRHARNPSRGRRRNAPWLPPPGPRAPCPRLEPGAPGFPCRSSPPPWRGRTTSRRRSPRISFRRLPASGPGAETATAGGPVPMRAFSPIPGSRAE